MKYYKIGKFIVFIGLAISIFFAVNFYLENLQYFIGVLIVMYGIDKGVMAVFTEKEKRPGLFCQSLIYLLLGLCTLLLFSDYKTVCVIWAVWAIMRESDELTECYEHFKERLPFILSFAESVVAIVLSITMIMEPGEHHARTHMYLLIVELMTSVIFPQLTCAYIKYIKKEKPESKE